MDIGEFIFCFKGKDGLSTIRGFIVFIAKKLPIIEGIDAVRNMFNRCWFDEAKCAQGLRALENYKKAWDDRHGCWKDSPVHDFASHGADAFRILATTLNEANRRGMTAEEHEKMRREAMGIPDYRNFFDTPNSHPFNSYY